jgi:hypothetical protein
VEVDLIDVDARKGWFVLVRGAAHHLDTEAAVTGTYCSWGS